MRLDHLLSRERRGTRRESFESQVEREGEAEEAEPDRRTAGGRETEAKAKSNGTCKTDNIN